MGRETPRIPELRDDEEWQSGINGKYIQRVICEILRENVQIKRAREMKETGLPQSSVRQKLRLFVERVRDVLVCVEFRVRDVELFADKSASGHSR